MTFRAIKGALEFLFLVAMAVLGALVGYWFLDDQLPYDYHYVGAQIIPDPAPAGGRVEVRWPITVHRLCPGVVHRALRDADTGAPTVQYDPTPSALTVRMGDREIRKSFELPLDLPRRLRYEATVCFKCNPLQAVFPICTATPSLTFDVKPR